MQWNFVYKFLRKKAETAETGNDKNVYLKKCQMSSFPMSEFHIFPLTPPLPQRPCSGSSSSRTSFTYSRIRGGGGPTVALLGPTTRGLALCRYFVAVACVPQHFHLI